MDKPQVEPKEWMGKRSTNYHSNWPQNTQKLKLLISTVDGETPISRGDS